MQEGNKSAFSEDSHFFTLKQCLIHIFPNTRHTVQQKFSSPSNNGIFLITVSLNPMTWVSIGTNTFDQIHFCCIKYILYT